MNKINMNKVGIDIVKLSRMDSVKDSFIKHVLTKTETEIYNSYSRKRQIEYLGGRFAAKEAIIKCLSEIEIPNMNEIEILNNEKGKPIVKYKEYDIDLSISHEDEYAVAVATLN